MPDTVNYPDILGLITGGNRCNLGAAQVAVAARPRLVRAGRPFEVLLLVQNALDGEIDVTMEVHVPPLDAKKQRDRFVTTTQRLVVRVKGGEVGYVVLPVTTLSDTAVSDGYRIGVEVEVKPLGKGNRIRAVEGGGKVTLENLSEETRAAIDTLKSLTFHTEKHRNTIEAPVIVMGSTVGKMTDFAPGWVSLCKISDYHDTRLLLHRYGGLVQINTLPRLRRATLLKPLIEATQTRFADAGYPLKDAEATAIAKLMTLVLEYASTRTNAHGTIAAKQFDVESLLERDPLTFETPPELPFWFRGLIDTLESDERAASYPSQVIPRYLYEELLRDAVQLGFALVIDATGVDFGSAEEQTAYCDHLLACLKQKSGLDFGLVYLPLVAAGATINEQVLTDKENPADLLREIGIALSERLDEIDEGERAIYTMIHSLIGRVGQRHGLYLEN